MTVDGSVIIKEDIETIANRIKEEAVKFSGKTIFISGGAGFLGKYFVGVFAYLNEHVLDKPCRVISADNFITGQNDSSFPRDANILEVWADVTNPLPIRERKII